MFLNCLAIWNSVSCSRFKVSLIWYIQYYLLTLLLCISLFLPPLLRYIFIPAQILFLFWAAAISICYFHPHEWVCCLLHSQWQPAEAFPQRLIASSLQCIRPSWAEPGIQRLISESGSSRWQFEHYCNSSRLTKYFLVKWHWNVFKYFITADCFITGISCGSVQNIRLLLGNYARWNGLKQQASMSAATTAKHSCKVWVWISQYLHECYKDETVSKSQTCTQGGRF